MRTEKVEFQLDCVDKIAKKFVPKLNDLGLRLPDTNEGDILKINYKLNILYFGTVDEVLRTFIEMIENGAVIQGDLVSDGEILIKRILESLQKIKSV